MIVYNSTLKQCTFEEYLQIPAHSHSGLKNDGAVIQSTPKMQLGTDVHNYLLTPELYKHTNSKLVRPIAMAIKAALGPLYKKMLPEQVVTADFEHERFVLAYKGRIDLFIPRHLVIDIKVTEANVAQTTQYFGYHNQLSGYAIATNVPRALIISINPKSLQTKTNTIPIHTKWWEQQIIKNGRPLL